MQDEEQNSISHITKEIVNSFIKAVEANNVISSDKILKNFSDLFKEDKAPNYEKIRESLFEELN